MGPRGRSRHFRKPGLQDGGGLLLVEDMVNKSVYNVGGDMFMCS